MTEYVEGGDLVKRLNIKPFELFERVKQGLQPLDRFGRPVPPPNISRQLARLKELNEEREKFLQEFGEIPSNLEALQRIPEIRRTMIMGLIELRERRRPRYEYDLNQIQTLQQELDQITDKHSWANYELPGDNQSAQWVIDFLMRSFFKTEDRGKRDRNRDKDSDIKDCRAAARRIIGESKANEMPSISETVRIIHSYEYGNPYSEKQIRNWITDGRKARIFPKESSKKGRKKNS